MIKTVIRTKLPRRFRIGLIVVIIVGTITLGLFVDVVGRIRSMVKGDKETAENPFSQPKAPLYNRNDPAMPVKLFFPTEQGDVVLGGVDDSIFRSAELTNRAKQILEKLLEGPKTPSPEFFNPIPKDTKVLEVFIDDTGLAYVDFSNPISVNHPGGMLNEQATVYSIVNSLTYNLPEIRQVKILVGGAEKETLAGHVLLLPLEMDLSLSNVTAPPQEQVPHAN